MTFLSSASYVSFLVAGERSVDEASIPDKPEVVVFARFGRMATDPVKVSLLGEMVKLYGDCFRNSLIFLCCCRFL